MFQIGVVSTRRWMASVQVSLVTRMMNWADFFMYCYARATYFQNRPAATPGFGTQHERPY